MHKISRRFMLAGSLAITVVRPSFAADTSVWKKLATVAYKGKQDDISFVDALTGWYGNGEGKLYRTTDAGETWTKI